MSSPKRKVSLSVATTGYNSASQISSATPSSPAQSVAVNVDVNEKTVSSGYSRSVNLNIDELKNFLEHIIENNRYIQSRGKTPVSVEVIGESGIGKTSSIIQLANEKKLSFIKLNLTQIEEIGDLVGFPIRQFQMSNDTEKIWIDENAVEEYSKLGFKFLGKNRMSYCPPEWISDKGDGGILLLDDWNRADIRFIQAVMELIDRQQYISWKLPKDWHIFLTSNPDNGEYIVNTIDPAQKTRFISANLKFDVECWARWAELNDIDSRCINFLLLHPEIVTTKVNARSIVMFFNSISSIKDFKASLPLIEMIGEGSVGEQFSTMFTLFINNNLDKLMSPEEILLNQDLPSVIEKMHNCIGVGDNYRADIASILATRMINYCALLGEKGEVKRPLIDRLAAVLVSKAFNQDIAYHIASKISNCHPSYKIMSLNVDLVKYII